jgi:hypothetical protein
MTTATAAYQIELKVDRLFPASIEFNPVADAYRMLKWDTRNGNRDEFRRYRDTITADLDANPTCKHRAAIRESLEFLRFA